MPSFLNSKVLRPNVALIAAKYYYPNEQSARMLWYHDHAMATTRLNAYAGIASAYIIRDRFETDFINKGLPVFVEKGSGEIPIIIQDKIFVSPDTKRNDPTWFDLVAKTRLGDLWYPDVYETPAR